MAAIGNGDPFHCLVCGKGFASMDDAQQHLRAEHINKKRVVAPNGS